MTKYRIIGNMTGNSMDAIDLVLTDFNGADMRDVCTYSRPFLKSTQRDMEELRTAVRGLDAADILAMPRFHQIHDRYVAAVADCVNDMCKKYGIDKAGVAAIGFHGKTLDHNPPSRALISGTVPYTLQIGSGQMLANLTGLRTVYDFRSDLIFNGYESAPLVGPHNAHVAHVCGDGCYYNGGNTSNFAWVINGQSVISTDAGPFNEYIDNFIRDHTADVFDADGKYGCTGRLNTDLLGRLFDVGAAFYSRALPRSGDPQYYDKAVVFDIIRRAGVPFADAVCTLEYLAAYVAVHALSMTDVTYRLPSRFVLFGGGWKNPVVRAAFDSLLRGTGYVMPAHRDMFARFRARIGASPVIEYSPLGEMMEARLFADMARYRLMGRPWCDNTVCGVVATPNARAVIRDKVNRAARGWSR